MQRIDFIDEITSSNRLKWTKYKEFNRHILLNITHRCNYSCPYCFYLQHRPHASQNYKLDDILKVIETVMETFEGESICWFIIGGEPTLYPLDDLLVIFDKILKYNRCIIEFQSNGSASLEYYETILPHLNCSDFSYHHKSCKDFEHFIDVVELFYKHDKLENLDLMFPEIVDDAFINNTRRLLKYGDHIEATYAYYGGRKTDERGMKFYEEIKDVVHPANHYVKFPGDNEVHILNKSELYKAQINCHGMICSSMNKYIGVNGNGEYAPCGTSIITNNREEIGNLLTKPEIFKLRSSFPHKCKEKECIGEWYCEKSLS